MQREIDCSFKLVGFEIVLCVFLAFLCFGF